MPETLLMVVRAKLFSPFTLEALVVVLVRVMSRPARASTLLSPTMAPPNIVNIGAGVQVDVCPLDGARSGW
ncbi:Uncharacterised protein [Leclercia adecarboxylata]|uniref:Uncharacterized protein n=1 Tax=Leclercia adecarboxylata TaxID=83655 RepID=A0A4V6JKC4_9ENTR|nr:Uncharacterised protein [Leclercia adecarboxylata]